jgi:hypothetical protein
MKREVALYSLTLLLASRGTLCFGAASKVYRYFGYGSNVLPSTMKALRRIEPIDATAAILPDYELRFDGSEDSRFEPSAAFVTPSKSSQVHGVLYSLTAEDFAKVGRTEGIPFVYRWTRCRLHPYVGDGEEAGRRALETLPSVEAFTLVSPKLGEKDVPPSSSYLGLIKEGARLWQFDQEYQDQLDTVQEAKNLIVAQGFSGMLLKAAELATGTRRDTK